MNITDLPEKYQKQVADKIGVESVKKGHKTNKYHNIEESINNIKFDSKKEKQRFTELKMLQDTGEIRNLKLQHEFTLQGAYTDVNGERIRAIKYIADFTYWRGNVFVIEDVKSEATAKDKTYRLKKKMMREKGWRITEI